MAFDFLRGRKKEARPPPEDLLAPSLTEGEAGEPRPAPPPPAEPKAPAAGPPAYKSTKELMESQLLVGSEGFVHAGAPAPSEAAHLAPTPAAAVPATERPSGAPGPAAPAAAPVDEVPLQPRPLSLRRAEGPAQRETDAALPPAAGGELDFGELGEISLRGAKAPVRGREMPKARRDRSRFKLVTPTIYRNLSDQELDRFQATFDLVRSKELPEDWVVAGVGWGVLVGVALHAATVLAQATSAYVRASFWLGLACGFIAFLAYPFFVASKRRDRIEETLPDALFQAAANPAETPQFQIIEQVSRSNMGPLSEEFSTVSEMRRRGHALHEALARMSNRVQSAIVSRGLRLFLRSNREGVDVKEALTALAEDVKQRFFMKKKRAAALHMQRITLIASAAVLVPLILGGVTGIALKMSRMGGGTGSDEGHPSGEGAAALKGFGEQVKTFELKRPEPVNDDGDNDGLTKKPRVDEDPYGDLGSDGCPGACGVDDDGDGLVDEDGPGCQCSGAGDKPCGGEGKDAKGAVCEFDASFADDDDEDGRIDEDPTEAEKLINDIRFYFGIYLFIHAVQAGVAIARQEGDLKLAVLYAPLILLPALALYRVSPGLVAAAFGG